jgi:hypothetical protein
MVRKWRQWLLGPKHGVARGVAVYGSPGYARDADTLKAHLKRCPALRRWAQDRGISLTGVMEDLQLLDHAIDGPPDDALTTSLANDVGLFLGTVIVTNVSGARWRVWPNGHPVVRTASGHDLDVVALASRRLTTGTPRLADVYTDAVAARP